MTTAMTYSKAINKALETLDTARAEHQDARQAFRISSADFHAYLQNSDFSRFSSRDEYKESPEYKNYQSASDRESAASDNERYAEIYLKTLVKHYLRFVANGLSEQIGERAGELADLPLWWKRTQAKIKEMLPENITFSLGYSSIDLRTCFKGCYCEEPVYIPYRQELSTIFLCDSGSYFDTAEKLKEWAARPKPKALTPKEIKSAINKAFKAQERAKKLIQEFNDKMEPLKEACQLVEGVKLPAQIVI